MLLPLTQNSLMNPLPNNSAGSLSITVAPSSLSSYPRPSNSISISLVSQDSFRTPPLPLPPISLHPHQLSYSAKLPPETLAWRSSTFPCNLRDPRPHLPVLSRRVLFWNKLELRRALGTHPAAGVLLTLLPAPTPPSLFSPHAVLRCLQRLRVCPYRPFNEQKCSSRSVCLLNS